MRAVIYARYSSDQQRAASIDDQIEICRRYVQSQGWQLVRAYDDAAISGASALTRPGFQRLMLDAQAGSFDVVVTEAIDRLARNLADVARCFDQLNFRRIQLHAIALGQVTALHVGLMGTMAQCNSVISRPKPSVGNLAVFAPPESQAAWPSVMTSSPPLPATRKVATAVSTLSRPRSSFGFFGSMLLAKRRAASPPR